MQEDEQLERDAFFLATDLSSLDSSTDGIGAFDGFSTSDYESANSDHGSDAGYREDTPREAFIKVATDLEGRKVAHSGSDAMASAVWRWGWQWSDTISFLKARYRGGTCYRSAQRCVESNTPPIKILVIHHDNVDEVAEEFLGEEFPRKKYRDTDRYRLQLEKTYVRLSDVIAYHQGIHDKLRKRCHTDNITLSIDGVPESNSNRTVDVVSVLFPFCRTVYCLQILRPAVGYHYDFDRNLQELVQEVISAGVRVRAFLADAPMRAKLRGHVGHNGRFGCDYCVLPAEQLGRIGRRPKLFWEAPTRVPDNSLHRTHDDMKAIVDNLDSLSPEEKKGMKSRSPLWDLPGFNVVDDIIVDPMHMVDKGTVARFLDQTFKMSTSANAREDGAPRLHVAQVNDLLRRQAVPREFSRRCRNIDFGNLKAEELKHMVNVMFTMIADAIPPTRPEHEAWLILAYLSRSYHMDSEADRDADRLQEMRELHVRFGILFQRSFGRAHMVYNIHMFSHMPHVREAGSISTSSCYGFESSYAIIRRSYVPGTTSTGKQALTKVYKHAAGRGHDRTHEHKCRRNVNIGTEAKATTRQDDSIVYVTEYEFLRVQSIVPPGDVLMCHVILSRPYVAPYGLDFTRVGVHVYGGVEVDELRLLPIRRSHVIGKGVLVRTQTEQQLLIAVSQDYLCEGRV